MVHTAKIFFQKRRMLLMQRWVFPDGSVVKNIPVSAGDTGDKGSFPGLGRSPGGGNGNLLQYSHLGNSLDRGDWQDTSPQLDMPEHRHPHSLSKSSPLFAK